MHRKSCKLEKHRHLYMWLQKPCWSHIVRAWRFRALTQKRLHSEICPETDVFCKNYVLNSFVWKWTLLYHVSHHLLGGWLSPGRTCSDLPWIGRWIQVQGGQTKIWQITLDFTGAASKQHRSQMNSLMHAVTWFSYLSKSLTLRSWRVASDLKPLRIFWHYQVSKMKSTWCTKNIGKWTDIWKTANTYNCTTESLKCPC